MTTRRSLAFFLAVLIVAIGILAPFAAGTARAHASLIRSNPGNNETLRRPPARIVLNFSEGIERRLTQIQVLDKNDQRFDDRAVAFDDTDSAFASVGVKTLEPGLYFVKWSNVSSVDGHSYKGSFPFIVLNSDGTFPAGVSLDATAGSQTSSGQLLPNNLDVTLKWLSLLSLALVAGAAFFVLAVVRPAASFLEDEAYARVTDAGERWLINLAHVLLPIAFIASALIVGLTVNRFETSTSVWSYLTDVRTGQLRGVQLVLIAIGLVGADVLFLGGTARKRQVGLGALLLTSVTALLMYSLESHGASGKGRFWSISSDYIHLLASSTWLGALVMLPPLLRWARRQPDDPQRFLYLANAFDRFSVVAGISVVAVLATGTFNGLAEIPNAHAMVDTTYGKVLLAKIALLAPLLVVAGLNAFLLKPRLVSVIDGLYQEGGTSAEPQRSQWSRELSRLQRLLSVTVAIEVALVVAIFAAVGVLTQTATAKGEIAQANALQANATKFNQSAEQNGLKLTLEVTPNRVGINEFALGLQNAGGTPSKTVSQARLRFNYDDIPGAVAPSEIILNKFADGDFRGAGAYFTQPGNWRVQVDVRRSDADDVSRAFVLPVGAAVASTRGKSDSAFGLPFTVFNWNEVAGAFLALAGGVIILYRRQLRWLEATSYRVGVAFAVALMLSGAVLAFGVHSHTAAIDPTKGNPQKPTAESVDRGKILFQQNCIVCHGIDGRGDGPQAASLSPAPSDFRLHTPLHTDPQFYAFISNGYPGSAMPSFKDAFPETDIWNLVNYLRSAFSEAPSQ